MLLLDGGAVPLWLGFGVGVPLWLGFGVGVSLCVGFGEGPLPLGVGVGVLRPLGAVVGVAPRPGVVVGMMLPPGTGVGVALWLGPGSHGAVCVVLGSGAGVPLRLGWGVEGALGAGLGFAEGLLLGWGSAEPDGAGLDPEPVAGTTWITMSWTVSPEESDVTSVTRTTVPGERLAGTETVAGISAGPAAVRWQARPPVPGTPSLPAGQSRWTVAVSGDAFASTTPLRLRGSTWSTYCTVPPGGAVASAPPVPVARGSPDGPPAIAGPVPATVGIAHRNKVAAQPQNTAEPAVTAVPT